MRRWGSVGLIAVSVLVAPIVAPAPAHAAVCIPILRQCTPTTSPPATSPPATSPPVTAPRAPASSVQTPVPPAPAAVDPDAAAAQFFDATNAARAASGLPALAWRADVAAMGVAHSAEMAQAGSIWHGSFVSSANLKVLNASSLGENVGMGQAVGQIHDALMNSEHHRENILDAGFNQVGIGVIVVDGGMFVTEDFLQAKGGPATARPTPVAHPVLVKKATTKAPTNKVAAAPKKVASSPSTSPTPPSTAAPTSTAPPTTESTAVVAALDALPATAPAEIAPRSASDHEGIAVAAVFGVLLLLGAAAGHIVVRRRRPTA